MRMPCWITGIYYTIRYPKVITRGEFITGHEYQFVDGSWRDYWLMQCDNCKHYAISELGPKTEVEEL